MKYSLAILVLFSWVLGQETVPKDLANELFRRIRGSGETQIYVGELPPLIAGLALELDEYVIVGGFQEANAFDQDEQTRAEAYLSYKGDWQKAAPELQSHFKTLNWKVMNFNYATAWGFASNAAFQSGDFCLENQRFSFSFYTTTQETKVTFFVEQIVGTNEMLICPESMNSSEPLASPMEGEALAPPMEVAPDVALESYIPPLYLEPPDESLVLVAENLPYSSPIPASQFMGVDLPGGWASRTTLATKLSPARVLSHYEKQMQELGWRKVQGGSTPLQEWSELELLEKNKKWLGTLSISHHEAYPGVVMPILMVLEKP